MNIVCLDLEGVLVPEIWIAFSKETGIEKLKLTTRDEPDYDKLMKYRLDILKEHNLKLQDIQNTISKIKVLDGAKEFLDELRELTQVVILSDTFSEFAAPLMKQLGYPTIFCNELVIDENNMIVDYKLRAKDGKRKAIEAFKSLNFKTFAAGDSYNDLSMIHKADGGCLFRAPESILKEEKSLKLTTTYDDFLTEIKAFLNKN
ncbi:MAG: bifunctional phosphoserine phosphatase/homoserine phosphotransferase ThrH [Sphaerochaetaceae bacterium]|nr:bifunctional phosphoserine phosphatase/homoserine phosphotransferase ThrH [Sphaerochaetaceae bacterium]MDC7238654.1 bifunctional phosphoserine phosphatase/homoserine phosphotransferase ThrH [Sphaerochaetaceae bacterium]MDC7243463.1 bifunctional phosphoserine phosphatase/homoserine phosphotransferase ThrH [Sphaerochaetaceae bacterium]MDC7250524.1 bifunctional phosphoserine phosphatase/homoserine phosphotransferase ThrH [Sphaerochaetaceae bacterium]